MIDNNKVVKSTSQLEKNLTHQTVIKLKVAR